MPHNALSHCCAEIDRLLELQFRLSSTRRWHVPFRWMSLRGSFRDPYHWRWFKHPGHHVSQLRNGQCLFRSNVIRMTGTPLEQDVPQPDGQIRRIEIRSIWRAVAADVNRSSVESIADKISDGKLRIERLVRPHERKTPGNLGLDPIGVRIEAAEQFRGSFPFCIGPVASSRVWGTTIILRKVGHAWHRWCVDCA